MSSTINAIGIMLHYDKLSNNFSYVAIITSDGLATYSNIHELIIISSVKGPE
jgi:hypothetical protein